MKTKKYVLLIAVLLILSCDGTGLNNTNETNHNDQTETDVLVSKGEVIDNSGNKIGYLLDAWAGNLNIYTLSGYIVNINWSGELTDFNTINFTGLDGTGTPFYNVMSSYSLRAKSVFYGKNKVYTFKNSDNNGIAISNPLITSYGSSCVYGKISNYDPSILIQSNYRAYELIETTKLNIGLPNSITLPLSINWD